METLTQNQTTVWNLDEAHSSIHFAVRHMVITETKGTFGKYALKVETNGTDFSTSKIELDIDVNSINTNAADRDNHLLSADFFDVATFPSVKIVSKSLTKLNDGEYRLTGELTIKDITKPIEFKVNYGGQIIDPWGNLRAGFKLEGSINRFDFGLNWNSLLETGNAVVGKIVKLEATIEIVTSNK